MKSSRVLGIRSRPVPTPHVRKRRHPLALLEAHDALADLRDVTGNVVPLNRGCVGKEWNLPVLGIACYCHVCGGGIRLVKV